MAYKLRRSFTRISIFVGIIGIVCAIVGKLLPQAQVEGETQHLLIVNHMPSLVGIGQLLFLAVLLFILIMFFIAYNTGVARRSDERLIGWLIFCYVLVPWSILIGYRSDAGPETRALGLGDLSTVTYWFSRQGESSVEVGIGAYVLLIGLLLMILSAMLMLFDYYTSVTRPVRVVKNQ